MKRTYSRLSETTLEKNDHIIDSLPAYPIVAHPVGANTRQKLTLDGLTLCSQRRFFSVTDVDLHVETTFAAKATDAKVKVVVVVTVADATVKLTRV